MTYREALETLMLQGYTIAVYPLVVERLDEFVSDNWGCFGTERQARSLPGNHHSIMLVDAAMYAEDIHDAFCTVFRSADYARLIFEREPYHYDDCPHGDGDRIKDVEREFDRLGLPVPNPEEYAHG
ncbi:MAG: hypothetical protein KGL39_20695 [Patescibacteria group bacterium]|nr:hypothetical protein [Patescibacteria group bacterium]